MFLTNVHCTFLKVVLDHRVIWLVKLWNHWFWFGVHCKWKILVSAQFRYRGIAQIEWLGSSSTQLLLSRKTGQRIQATGLRINEDRGGEVGGGGLNQQGHEGLYTYPSSAWCCQARMRQTQAPNNLSTRRHVSCLYPKCLQQMGKIISRNSPDTLGDSEFTAHCLLRWQLRYALPHKLYMPILFWMLSYL